MQLPGYAGSILFVNLTDGSYTKEPLDAEMTHTFIGGAGISSKLAYDLIPPNCDPLSAENAIIIGTGPFNGTMIPGASELMIIYKSPLNGSFPYSSGGGRFSHMIKSAGYDQVVLTGRSSKPVYLVIGDQSVELIDASDLWGRDSFETTDELRKRHEPCSVIPIGQAGENLVAISVSQIVKGGTVGSGGLPAVMGSKNLKAIVAVQGNVGIRIADPRRLHRLVDEILENVASYHRRDEMLLGGSMSMTKDWVGPGIPLRCSTVLESYSPNTGDIQAQIYDLHVQARKRIACATCPIGDKDRIDFKEKDLVVYDTAIMTDMAIMAASPFGHSSAQSAPEIYADALRYFDLSNRYGVDRVYSFRGLVDFIVTLYEEGVIDKNDTGGLELNREMGTILELLRMVTFREGIGDIIADGIGEAVNRIGRGADKYARNVVKGQYPFSDPRVGVFGPMEFASLVYPGRVMGFAGATGAFAYNPGWPIDQIRKQVQRCGIDNDVLDQICNEESLNLGRMVKHGEEFFILFNMLGMCYRIYISRFQNLGLVAQLYSAVTGVEVTLGDLKLAGERVWNIWRTLNYRAGFDRKDDQPPEVWFEPLKSEREEFHLTDYFQRKRLGREDVDGMLDEYYEEHGWEKERGIPTIDKLNELGLANMASDIE